MPTFIGIGFSKDRNPFNASRQATQAAKLQTKRQKIDLVLVFSSIHYAHDETIRGILQVVGDTPIVGCSSAGIMLPHGTEKEGLGIVVLSSDEIKVGLGLCEDIITNRERLCGNEVCRNTIENLGPYQKHLFTLISDGLIKNTADLIKGVREVLGMGFPFISGTSSDDFSFFKTYQYYQNRILTNSAVGILWGGEMSFGIGVKHGWRPLGKPRIATDTEGNIIKRIDHQPAIRIYEDYFGKDSEELRSNRLGRMAILYPLGIYIPQEKEYLLRNVLEADADGLLICQGDIPVNSEIRLMIGNKDSCLSATREAALEAKEATYGKEVLLVIVFNSTSRRKLLGRDAVKETEIIQDVFGNIPLAGFYTFGEGAPLKTQDYRREIYFHNENIIILAIAK